MIVFVYILCGLVVAAAFLFSVYLIRWIRAQKLENPEIKRVAGLIRAGANAFIRKEYLVLAAFSLTAALLIFIFLPVPLYARGADAARNAYTALCYLFGTVLSALACRVGLFVASLANGRCAEAAQKDEKSAFLVGFRGGAVMGLIVMAVCLLGVMLVMLVFRDPSILLSFSFGASSLALFAKAGGGIFTKTADVSADLVGKVELGIPEDDPRNPAVIADNVGDNVGDVAGMGADLFDSNVATMAAALVMATAMGGKNPAMVFCYAALGLLSSIIGIYTAKINGKGTATRALNRSTYVSTFMFLGLTALFTLILGFAWRYFFASAVGLSVGVLIGLCTGFFTDDERPVVKLVAKASASGPAFTVLSGISYGLLSALPAMAGIAVSALIAHRLGGMFGIAMSAVGMLSIVGTIISNDAYGPIVDNARGLAEMGGLGDRALETADRLDSAGNTVKAITKGFAIGAAGLTVISLLGAFMQEVNETIAKINAAVTDATRMIPLLSGFNLTDPTVFFGILVGAAVPAVFSAMLILGVNRNAQRMMGEIRRQFSEIPGLKEGAPGASPDYNRCITIATSGALKELIPAGLVAIAATILAGFVGGVGAMGGFLLGNIVSGLLLALFMSNAGGLWDNAKKYIEAGHEGGKGSDAHRAAVIGDTVGDPFKDTAGPSINTQITVVSLIASLLAQVFVRLHFF